MKKIVKDTKNTVKIKTALEDSNMETMQFIREKTSSLIFVVVRLCVLC